MPVKDDASTRFTDEIKAIPTWAFAIALLGFLSICAIFGYLFFVNREPFWVMLAMGIVGGTLFACYVLLVGYVNSDAGRRGMNRALWTMLAIFIPNALGIVLYFILRKPRPSNCPQCGAPVQPGFGFCPQCRHRLTRLCSQCQRSVKLDDRFCPYCGCVLETSGRD
jgi:hypothetical protein